MENNILASGLWLGVVPKGGSRSLVVTSDDLTVLPASSKRLFADGLMDCPRGRLEAEAARKGRRKGTHSAGTAADMDGCRLYGGSVPAGLLARLVQIPLYHAARAGTLK